MHRLDLGLYSHPKEFLGECSLNPREKSLYRKISPEEDRTRDAVDSVPRHYRAIPAPCPKTKSVCLFVGCLTSQQQAHVSQGQICIDNFTCCHTETEVTDPTFYLTQSQYTDTGPTSPSGDPIMPGTRQDSLWSANF